MTLAAGIREAWVIGAAKPIGSGLRATHFEGAGRRIWATVSDNHHRGLLVAVPPEEQLSSSVATIKRTSSALDAEIYRFDEDGRSMRGLHVWCTNSDLLEAFVGFCEPFIVRIHKGEPVEIAFSISFREFKRLLGGSSDLEISTTVIGLLGELAILSELAVLNSEALSFWPYPDLERHDFRNGKAAIEVKTSLRSQSARKIATISALDQLEAPSGGTLYLHWLRLERDPAGTVTVARLVDEIARNLNRFHADELRSRVLSDQRIQAYQFSSFSLYERQTFRVEGAFPKLTPSSLVEGALDPGVGKVTYEVDLSAAAAFRCSSEEANRALVAGGSKQ